MVEQCLPGNPSHADGHRGRMHASSILAGVALDPAQCVSQPVDLGLLPMNEPRPLPFRAWSSRPASVCEHGRNERSAVSAFHVYPPGRIAQPVASSDAFARLGLGVSFRAVLAPHTLPLRFRRLGPVCAHLYLGTSRKLSAGYGK